MAQPHLVTFGHGTAGRAEPVELLRGAGVASVVDIRTAPGSRRDPEPHRGRLAERLPEEGFGYRWEKRLGGFREPAPDSPDMVWRDTSFRACAGHTRPPGFVSATGELLERAVRGRTAVMCSEAVWWRCHRRLVADFAVPARGTPVDHLTHDGRLTPHSPTPGVRLRPDGLLVYDDVEAADASTAAPGRSRRTG